MNSSAVEAAQRLQAAGMIVGVDGELQACPELLVAVGVKAIEGRFLVRLRLSTCWFKASVVIS
jgi:hypothetical protein